MKCDLCQKPVRIVEHGLHVGAFRHDNDQSDLDAQFCETDSGYVRVTVGGKQDDPIRTARRL